MYFGANLILIFDYKLTFGTKIRSSDDDNRIEVIIISIKGSSWKSNDGTLNIKLNYSNNGDKINEILKPSRSDAYAFIYKQ